MPEDYTRTEEKLEPQDRHQVTIEVLPDNVFLDIFDIYIQEARHSCPFNGIEAWKTLVHVCRHWRTVVFVSPLRLDLQLFCTDKTPAREMLDIWPPLPILIRAQGPIPDVDNIVASLKYNDLIREIVLYETPDLLLEKVSVALMQESFPALTYLELVSSPKMDSVLPPGPYSGGSAPLLKEIVLDGFLFRSRELSNFLSSSVKHLTSLVLSNIPSSEIESRYISPETMVTCISALINLEELYLEFQLPHWGSQCPHPRLPTRFVQPALVVFSFHGISEYLEDFVARIDAPQLGRLFISFFDETIFDTSQIVQFIYRRPSLKAPDEACLRFFDDTVRFTFSSQTCGSGELSVEIVCRGSYSELSIMVQFCTSLSCHVSSVETLYIYKYTPHQQDSDTQDDTENADQEWLDFLRPFTATKDIYLCETSAQHIAFVLQEVADGRLTEVLPMLQNMFLSAIPPSGPIQEGIVQFVAVRELSGRPIAVSSWPTGDRRADN